MICIVDTPVDLANFVELHNLILSGKGRSAGQRSVTALPWADFSAMQADEKLYVLAHGSPTEIGDNPGYTAPKFAKALLDRGLPKIAKMILVACKTAMPSQSYCAVLHNELLRQSRNTIDVPVTGFTGYAVTNRFGKTRAIDPAKEKKLRVQYDDIFDRWARKVENWEGTAGKLPYATQADLIDGAKIMAMKSKDFFAELYEINARMVKSKADSKDYGR